MTDPTLPQKVLVVDADRSVGQGLKGTLEKYNIKVDLAPDLSSALYLYNQNLYPVVLVDLLFEELPGLVLIQRWRSHEVHDKRHAGFIVMSGNRNTHEASDRRLVEELEDIEMIHKPINPLHLLPLFKRFMQIRQRRIKFGEISAQALKLAGHPDTFQAAVDFVKANMKDLGPRGSDLLREVLEMQKKWRKALDVVEDVLTQKPSSLSALNHKGRLLLKLGKPHEALRVMEVADKQAPANIQRINEMAIAYLETKMPDQSVSKMRELLRYHPDKPDIKFDMFARLQEYGYDDHAISLCKDTTDPLEVVRHYNNKGVALAKSGNVEGAIMEYERALSFFPKYKENYRILYNIALAHLSFKTRSHYEVALEYVHQCLELNRGFDKAQKTKELISEQLNKKGRAV